MKIVEMDEAHGSLSEYARRNRRDAVVVTRRGKPVSALLPLDPGVDLERLALSMNRRFRVILECSRAEVQAGRVVTSGDVRRMFKLKSKTR